MAEKEKTKAEEKPKKSSASKKSTKTTSSKSAKPKKSTEEKKTAVKKSTTKKKTEAKTTKTTRKKTTTKSKKKVKGKKVAVARGKRKEAIARAVVKEGKGRFTFNKKSVSSLNNTYFQELLREPLYIATGSEKLDISVTVKGGGALGQIQAARRAIAVALVEFFGDEKLWDKFYEADKFLVVEDPRRVEPKKYKGRKARARFQKSYR